MVVYVVVTSFLRNVAFLIYALFGEISILEIPVVGNFSLFAGLLWYFRSNISSGLLPFLGGLNTTFCDNFLPWRCCICEL